MIQPLLNAMRMQAQLEGQARITSLLGVVSSYDPDNYCAKVMLNGEVETGWLPVTSPQVGNGWGIFAAPSLGDTVEVRFQGDDIDAGYICLRFFTTKMRPVSTKQGEIFLMHKSGSALKFNDNGSVDLIAHTDLTATVGGALNANVTGNMIASVTGSTTISGSTIEFKGGGAAGKGIVQADCMCAFTGAPHPMVSAKVKGSM